MSEVIGSNVHFDPTQDPLIKDATNKLKRVFRFGPEGVDYESLRVNLHNLASKYNKSYKVKEEENEEDNTNAKIIIDESDGLLDETWYTHTPSILVAIGFVNAPGNGVT